MELLAHTISLEPARWTPQRVSQSLAALLPRIAALGIGAVEVFEPHLTDQPVSEEIKGRMTDAGTKPVILSSYLNLNPEKTSDEALESGIELLRRRVEFYGFAAVRLFPGSGMDPSDGDGVERFKRRLRRVTDRLEGVDLLLETHDHSLADDPALIVRMVEEFDHPRLGLLFQPTCFRDVGQILAQFDLQRPFIRHLHLQNRGEDGSFSTLEKGVVPWPHFFSELPDTVGATLEFVPVAICGVEDFDLEKALAEVASEMAFIRSLSSRRSLVASKVNDTEAIRAGGGR